MIRLMPCLLRLNRIPVLLVSICAFSTSGYALDVEDPWSVLEELRDNLAAGTLRAGFVQIYRPAGFTTGDRETGHLHLSLPDCVRWDYDEPYPKAFLLCQSTIYTWNPGDRAGRRFQLADTDEPGIDLLRLHLDDLRRRYEARVERTQDGSFEVILSPLVASSTIVEARVTMDSERQVLSNLSYRDLEGNVSEFEITAYQPFADAGQFEPPSDLDWLDQ